MPIIAPTNNVTASSKEAPAVAVSKSLIVPAWWFSTAATGQPDLYLCPFSLDTLQFGDILSPSGCFLAAAPAMVFWHGMYYTVFNSDDGDGTFWYVMTDLVAVSQVFQVPPSGSPPSDNTTPALAADDDLLILAYATTSNTLAYYILRRDWLMTGPPGSVVTSSKASPWETAVVASSVAGVAGPIGFTTAKTKSGPFWMALWLANGALQYAITSGNPGNNSWDPSPFTCENFKPTPASAPSLVTYRNTIWAIWPDTGAQGVVASEYAADSDTWSTPVSVTRRQISAAAKLSATATEEGIVLGYNDPNVGIGFLRVRL